MTMSCIQTACLDIINEPSYVPEVVINPQGRRYRTKLSTQSSRESHQKITVCHTLFSTFCYWPCWSGLLWPAKFETTAAWCGSCYSRRFPQSFASWTSSPGVLRPAHPWTPHTATAQSPLDTIKQQHTINNVSFFVTYTNRDIVGHTHQLHFHLAWLNQWRSCKYKSSVSTCRE